MVGKDCVRSKQKTELDRNDNSREETTKQRRTEGGSGYQAERCGIEKKGRDAGEK